jgi:ABC-2 type transport system ATP-binding protein
MSVEVIHLSKSFDEQKALDDLSFKAVEGKILGFLGPNGAGKSTTMKIATGYIPPSSGTVMINGYDVRHSSLEVRKLTGYLPEHNPLYTDMYIPELLKFCGSLYGLKGKKLKQRTEEMMELCGLLPELGKKIAQLSKGYRQRVGLAQALIHEPEVLILDEPTSGLDPNQITEIRSLIKNLSKKKTVVLSTHIMQEVEALCDEVVIINKGKIVGQGSVDELSQSVHTQHALKVEFSDAPPVELLMRVEGVLDIEYLSPRVLRLHCIKEHDTRKALLAFAAEHHVDLLGFQVEKTSLEQVFAHLTQTPESVK